jgi:hypothetical protein
MACSCNIAAHQNPFNQAVLGDDAWYFSGENDIAMIIDKPADETMKDLRKQHNREKIKTVYDWKSVTDAYEKLMREKLKLH